MSFSFACWNEVKELTSGKSGCWCCLSDLWDRSVQLKNGRRYRKPFVCLSNQDAEQMTHPAPSQPTDGSM